MTTFIEQYHLTHNIIEYAVSLGKNKVMLAGAILITIAALSYVWRTIAGWLHR